LKLPKGLKGFQQKYLSVPCPYCDSIKTVARGYPRRLCKDCGKSFQLIQDKQIVKPKLYSKPKLACEYCGKEFTPKRALSKDPQRQQRFCCRNHQRLAWRKTHSTKPKIEKKCVICDSSFVSKFIHQVYCSSKCRNKASNLKKHRITRRKPKPKKLKPKAKFIEISTLIPNAFDIIERKKMDLKRKRWFNVDSVINVPCFCCDSLEIDCDVARCEKLNKFLESPQISKVIVVAQ
jgi:hypothetical protein